MIIMAIDLGKFKSMVCHYSTDTKEHTFDTVATEPLQVGAAGRFLRRPSAAPVSIGMHRQTRPNHQTWAATTTNAVARVCLVQLALQPVE